MSASQPSEPTLADAFQGWAGQLHEHIARLSSEVDHQRARGNLGPESPPAKRKRRARVGIDAYQPWRLTTDPGRVQKPGLEVHRDPDKPWMTSYAPWKD